jgi:CubicO group peptidase (beta-lactamase class C family)
MKRSIFDRLGMASTQVFKPDSGISEPALRAYGYRYSEAGEYEFADQNLTSSVLGDGGIYCSLEDYGLWNRALSAGSMIGEPLRSEMFLPGRLTDGREIPYGMGWRLERADAVESPDVAAGSSSWLAYHPGGTTGFNHCVRRLVDGKHTIMLLTNRSAAGAREISAELAAHMRRLK